MIPIAFVAIVESMLMQFSLRDITGTIALVVSAITFYISHTQASQSEQIKTSRYVWERINEKFDKIREIAKTKGWPTDKSGQDILWSVVMEIDYFAYLILNGEIKDEIVLGYYKTYLSQYIESILKYYTSADQRYFLCDDYRHFYKIIKKWKITNIDEEMT